MTRNLALVAAMYFLGAAMLVSSVLDVAVLLQRYKQIEALQAIVSELGAKP